MFPCPLLILAGGRATRLGTLASETPKFLMPIDAGRCFADLQLEWVAKQGFRDVILCVGHLGKKIEDYCGKGERYGLRLRYSYDGDELMGTGGAVKKALQHSAETVAVTYGDTILAVNAATVYAQRDKSGGHAFMTVFKNTVPGHVCNANIVGDRVEYSKKSPQLSFEYIDYGFLILGSDFVRQLPSDRAFDLAEELERVSRAGELAGSVIGERFWEMGTPESYEEFKKRFQP